jgi:hypothetical protein
MRGPNKERSGRQEVVDVQDHPVPVGVGLDIKDRTPLARIQ